MKVQVYGHLEKLGRARPALAGYRAGHSVAVLLKVYAKCIDGQDQVAKQRIEDALRDPGQLRGRHAARA